MIMPYPWDPPSGRNLRRHLSEGCGNTFRIQCLRPSKGQKWKLQCEGENVTRLTGFEFFSQPVMSSEPETGSNKMPTGFIFVYSVEQPTKLYKMLY